jgi:hypothetical protein
MLPSRSCSLVPALALALGFISTDVLADPPTRHGRGHMAGRTAVHPRYVARHHHHLVRQDVGPSGRPYVPVYPGSGSAGPGYVFVPGKGILGEDCNMPTSTCPNEVRDTQ